MVDSTQPAPAAKAVKVKPVGWWRKGRVWRRIGSDLTALIVGVIAAIISWTHIVHVVIEYGKQTQAIMGLQVANLYPVSVDGAMVVGVIAAADDRANGLEVRRWARIATWFGGIFSIAAQVTSAWPYGPVAWVIAAVPSGALIVVIEVLTKRGKIASGTLKVRWYHSKKRRAQLAAINNGTAAATVPAPPAEAVAEALPEPVAPVVVPPVPAAVTEPMAPASEPTPVDVAAPVPPKGPGGPRQSQRRRAPARATESKGTQPTKAARAAAAPLFMSGETTTEPVAESPVEAVTATVDDGPRAIGTGDTVIVAEVVPDAVDVR